jgi:hypothetical protein
MCFEASIGMFEWLAYVTDAMLLSSIVTAQDSRDTAVHNISQFNSSWEWGKLTEHL